VSLTAGKSFGEAEMVGWTKDEIVIANGTKVSAQMPVIISASRSTDVPAFYADWFMVNQRVGAY
jgi:hypothetical protein